MLGARILVICKGADRIIFVTVDEVKCSVAGEAIVRLLFENSSVLFHNYLFQINLNF